MGRPPIDDAKTKSYRLRMTENEFNCLTELSELCEMTKADVIREGLSMVYNYRWHLYPKEDPLYTGLYIVTYKDFEGFNTSTSALYGYEHEVGIGFQPLDEQYSPLFDDKDVIAWMEYPLPWDYNRAKLREKKG